MQVWPTVIDHVYLLKIDCGILTCMSSALFTPSIHGRRYPLQMLPLPLFEIAWKAAWLRTEALPH